MVDRGIKDGAIVIWKHPHNMNRDEGWFQLFHLYNDLPSPHTNTDVGGGRQPHLGCLSVYNAMIL